LVLKTTLKWVTFPYSSERFDARSLLLQTAVLINLGSSFGLSPRTPCYGYYGVTPRLHTVSNDQNGLNINYSYQSGTGQDFRLTDISNYSTGTSEVRLYIAEHVYYPNGQIGGPDYHWERKDSNGQWSSKHGSAPVGPQVPDPDSDADSWGYTIHCGTLCATSGKK